MATLIGPLTARPWGRWIPWAIYLALLGVLLPHTAWAFGRFEPEAWSWLGWVAAIAFEGAIATFTWRLKGTIEATTRHRSTWLRFRRRYLNVYGLGLLVAIAISSAANWAHSVQFGQPFAVFGLYSVPPLAFSIAFGGILPVCSLLFARILADVQDLEVETNPELMRVKDNVSVLRRQLRESEHALAKAEQRANQAEDAARLIIRLSAEDKAARILAAREQWPELPQAGVAVITGTSPAYVSQVLKAAEETEG
jgi:hypothetical protein